MNKSLNIKQIKDLIVYNRPSALIYFYDNTYCLYSFFKELTTDSEEHVEYIERAMDKFHHYVRHEGFVDDLEPADRTTELDREIGKYFEEKKNE